MEKITDTYYMYAKRICTDSEIKNVGDYHDFYLKSNTLLLADVLKTSKKCI